MQNDFRPSRAVRPALPLKPTFSTNTKSEPTAPFKTPEQVNAQEAAQFSPTATLVLDNAPARGTGHHWFNLPWPPKRHETILISVVVLMALIGVVGFMKFHHTASTPVAVTVPTKKAAVVPPQPTTVASSLSGLAVAPDVNQRPVVGVMIENSQTARPQSGLGQASVIFEAIAEGGITRFLALYQDQQPTNIGPVRSARPYFVQWNEGFRAAYAHVGGSPDALSDIKSWNVQDLNQFYNSGPYHRVSSRPAPHNLYSSVVDLATLATQKGFKSDYSGFSRKSASPTKQTTASNINLNISSALYNSHYTYDAASNTYARSEGGAPQIDSNTDKQLTPSVVIAMVVPLSAGAKTAQGGSYSDYNPIGSGTAYIFQDGSVITGKWTKSSTTSQLSFSDSNGSVVKLNPGQTWITAVDASSKVTYQ